MAIVTYKGTVTNTKTGKTGKTEAEVGYTPKSASGPDTDSSRIAAERAASGKVSLGTERNENAAQRKARLGIMDTPDGGVAPVSGEVLGEQIDTTQPSPTKVSAAGLPGNTIGQGSLSSSTGALTLPNTPKDFSQAMMQGYQNVVASGAQPPATKGAAESVIQGAIPQTSPDMSSVDTMLAEDKGWQELLQIKKDYFDPSEQKTSLMDTYKKLYKQSGLGELDEEIIDAKTVIEGTEDDIRNEIQAAGGFGTDSQVQALALARNKSLLKNYNNLVAMREMKENHLNTMMSLAEKDRAYADQQFDKALNFNFKVMEYRDKFMQNTQSNLQNMAKIIGWDGVYSAYSKDPRQLAMAEKIMGVPSGSLAMAGAQAAKQRAQQEQMASLEMVNQSLQNQKLRQSMSPAGEVLGINSGALMDATGKPIKLTATQVDSLAGFDNTLGGAQKAQALLAKGVKTGPWESAKLSAAKLFDKASPDQLDMEQTLAKIKADFMKSISGAAVSESEAKRLAKFLPEFGDQEGVITAKLKNLIEESNKSKTNFLKTLGAVEARGNIVVGPDGNEYEIVN